MTLPGVAWRYLRHRGGQTAAAAAAVAAAAALALAIPWIAEGARGAIGRHVARWNLAIAAEGGEVQVALATLFYVEPPTGNIPRAVLDEVRADPLVEAAVPIALGDRSRGRPIVGTEPAYLEGLPPVRGRLWERPFEAVVGAGLARAFPPGSTFESHHGAVGAAHAGSTYKVVGVLPPTGGPDDVAIFTALESIWAVHGGADTEVTAVLVRYRNPVAAFAAQRAWAARPGLAAILPARTATRLYGLVGRGADVLGAVALVVVAVAALSVLLAVSSAAAARTREFALLRVLGCRRRYLFGLAVLEGGLLGGLGGLAGTAAAAGVFAAASAWTAHRTGMALAAPDAPFAALSAAAAVAGLALVGALAALPAAFAAYRLDVARHVRGEV